MADFLSLGVRLKTLLDLKKMSQSAFAKKIDSSPQTINNITGGTHLPRMNVVEEIYKVFPELNLHWFLTGEGDIWLGNDIEKAAISNATQDLFKYQQNLIIKCNETLNKQNEEIRSLQEKLEECLQS